MSFQPPPPPPPFPGDGPPPFGPPPGDGSFPPPPPPCGPPPDLPEMINLRIAAIFVLLVGSTLGAVIPILIRPKKPTRWGTLFFDFCKYFGSGVIIATAFIHLLSPAFASLESACLRGPWHDYSWAPAFAMVSVFAVFFVELFAFRVGKAHLDRVHASTYDPHGHNLGDLGGLSAHGPEMRSESTPRTGTPEPEAKLGTHPASKMERPATGSADSEVASTSAKTAVVDRKPDHHHHKHHGHDLEHAGVDMMTHTAWAQIVGVAILEFGVVFHSILIGLTLAVDREFKALFIVISLHQTFEGLGLGARLATLELPHKYRFMPLFGALLFGITTPIGIAAGLAVRRTYSPDQPIASVISGVFDAISAGILLYTGLVELLAHEFLFSPHMHRQSNAKLLFACASMMVGAALMSVLGRWA